MRSLKQYIAESVHLYNYRIYVAGDVDKNKLDLLHYNLKKFSPTKISEPKTTPIQKDLLKFPDVNNERVTIIDMDCRYPVIEPIVRQLAQLLGMDENRVRLVNTKYGDSMDTENEEYANEMKNSPLLTHEEMGSAHGADEAKKAYSNSYLESIKDQNKDSKIDIPYEGKKTPSAFDPFKAMPEDKKGQNSPMTKIKMPPKPKTGAKFNK